MSHSSGSDREAPVAKEKGSDWAWKHCVPLDPSKRSKVKCNYCDKVIGGGGITRFKHHIVGGDPNVAKCKKCPQSVRDDFKTAMKAKKVEKAGKKAAEELYYDTLFNVRNRELASSEESDDDIVYPMGYGDTPQLRRMYRRQRKDIMKSEWEQAQADEARRVGAGSSLPQAQARARPVVDIDDDVVEDRRKKSGRGIMDDFVRSASMRLTGNVYNEPGVRRPEKTKQSTLKQLVKGLANTKEKVGRAIGLFYHAHGIPAHTASEPYLKHMVREIGAAGPNVDPPTAWELMNKYLPAQKQEILEWVERMKERYPEYGVTLMSDGWTSGNRKQIINFLVYCRGATIYLDSVDASENVRNSKFIEGLLEKYLHQIGIQNVVQIVTDNGSSFKKAGKHLMKKYPIYWTPCAAHCIDLILKDICALNHVKQTVAEARSITKYIYNHSFLLASMRRKEYCNGDLVRPGQTRFATNFLALQSLKTKSDGLKRLFAGPEWYSMKRERESEAGTKIEELIHRKDFWDKVRQLLKIMEPIVKVLRIVDGDKSPTMGCLYDAMTKMREAVKEAAPRSSVQYLNIIDQRWNNMLLHPLHRAAHYLNPGFQYKQNLGLKAEFMQAVKEVVERLTTSVTKRIRIMDQIRYFREGLGSFGHPNAVETRERQDPIEWWAWHGAGCDELRALAIRVLSQTAAAGGCERNWSTFNLIHSKRRNKLGAQRLSDLVYVHYNMRLRSRNIREAAFREVELAMIHDPIDTAYTFAGAGNTNDPLQQWMDDLSATAGLDGAGGQPDPEIEDTYETASEEDDEDQNLNQMNVPGSLDPEPQHVAADMDIDSAVQERLSGSGKDKSKSTSSSSTTKSDDHGGHDGAGSGSDYRTPYGQQDDDPDRPYLYADDRQRTVVAPPTESEAQKQQRVYSKRKTRGNKEYTASAYPQGPHYPSDTMSDLAESVGSMGISDTGGSNFGDQLFGYPRSDTHSGYGGGYGYNSSSYDTSSTYGYGYDPGYGYGSVPPPPPPPQEETPPAVAGYSYGFFGGMQMPQGGYHYSTSYRTEDGGQSWHGTQSIIPVQAPMVIPLPVAYAPVPVAPPPAPPARPRRTREQRLQEERELKELEKTYPKMGMMANVNDEVYRDHVNTYNTHYRLHLTWVEYVNHINQLLYGERSTEPARHSHYY